MYYDVIMTGFGGQGIQLISQIMAIACIDKGLELTYLPSYGVEKRGGRTDVTVVISDEEIGSPITDKPCSLIAMDPIGLDFYQKQLKKDGLLVANTSLINEEKIINSGARIIRINSNHEAIEMGNPKLANMIIFGGFLDNLSFIDFNDIEKAVYAVIPERLKKTIPDNLKAIQQGIKISKDNKKIQIL